MRVWDGLGKELSKVNMSLIYDGLENHAEYVTAAMYSVQSRANSGHGIE